MPFIPEDIIIQIIDQIPSDFLPVCSIVSRSFLCPCQRRIFASVGVFSFRGTERCRKLHQLLTRSPHIAPYIHNLTLQNGWWMDPVDQFKYMWILKEPTVSPLLDMLTTLQFLDIKSSANKLEWSAMSQSLQASFIRLFTLPSLAKIRLHNVKFPAAVFAHSTQLVELAVLRSELYSSINTPPLSANIPSTSGLLPSWSKKPCLRILSMTSKVTETFVEDLSSVVDISQLHGLTLLDSDEVTLRAVAAIMALSGSSLERFKWDIHYIPGWLTEIESPSPLVLTPKIRFLEVNIPGWVDGNETVNPLRWAIAALTDIAAHQESSVDLEELALGITIESYELCQWDQWTQLDITLARADIFSNLRQVKVTLHKSDKRDTDWLIPMTERLGRLAARGILLVN